MLRADYCCLTSVGEFDENLCFFDEFDNNNNNIIRNGSSCSCNCSAVYEEDQVAHHCMYTSSPSSCKAYYERSTYKSEAVIKFCNRNAKEILSIMWVKGRCHIEPI